MPKRADVTVTTIQIGCSLSRNEIMRSQGGKHQDFHQIYYPESQLRTLAEQIECLCMYACNNNLPSPSRQSPFESPTFFRVQCHLTTCYST